MPPPHLLLITTDQQRFDTVACAGNQRIWTPHLDWLCDGGVRFDNAYSDCPVCLPARTTLMTGLHAWRHGVMSNRWVEGACTPDGSLAGRLGRAGYQTRLVGKQHHGPGIRHLMGFDAQEETADYFRFYHQHPQLGTPRAGGLGMNEHVPGIDTVGEEHSLSHWAVRRSIDFLETRDPSRPFFLWLSFHDPHPPFVPCASWAQQYAQAEVPAPWRGDWSRTADAVPAGFQAVTRELSMTQRLDAERIRQARRAYYALISQVDAHLGLLFGWLGELGLMQDTWIVFTSDHGEMLGDHHLGGKCVPFEGSARVPLIVRPAASPRQLHPLRGSTSDALVCLADIMPTLLNLAGAPVPDGLDGLDLMAAQTDTARRERLFGSCGGYLHYLKEGTLKYCRETLDGRELLFDLATDPHEERDLSASHPALSRLRRLLEEHLQALGTVRDPAVPTSSADLPANVHPGLRSQVGNEK